MLNNENYQEIKGELRSLYMDTVLYMKIESTSQLETDLNVLHPCVKIHFVDIMTGKYISKYQLPNHHRCVQ